MLGASVALSDPLQAAEPSTSLTTAPTSTAAARPGSASSTRPDLAKAARRIVDLTNAFRRTHHLPDVNPDAQLAKAAQYFAEFMSRTDQLGHSVDGSQPSERVKRFGYQYCSVAENIAYEFNSAGLTTDELARNLLQGWQNSAGHRKNMLDADVTQTAVAVSLSSRSGRYYAVQLFGRPQSQVIEFSIANQAGVQVEYQLDDQSFSLPPLATRTHQTCRLPQLRFRGETLQPTNRQRLLVVNEQGSVRLQAQ